MTLAVVPPLRFASSGGDLFEQIGGLRRYLTEDEAVEKLITWREQEAKWRKIDPALADVFARDAEQIADALEAYHDWKRCARRFSLANVGRSALEASVALLTKDDVVFIPHETPGA